jgi:sec-independent protein translocase protein TatB
MFDIGFWEVVLILVLALLLLGPERLPHAARTVGQWVGRARRYVEGVRSEVEKEFDVHEMKRLLHNQEVQLRELQSKLAHTENYLNRDASSLDSAKTDAAAEIPKAEPQYEIIEDPSPAPQQKTADAAVKSSDATPDKSA